MNRKKCHRLVLVLMLAFGAGAKALAETESPYTGTTNTATAKAASTQPPAGVPKPSLSTNAPAPVVTPPSNPILVATLTTGDLKEFAELTPEIQALIARGLELTRMNLKYQYGSDDPQNGGMDCSGTVHYLLEQAGLKDVPRDSSGLYSWVWKKGRVEPVVSTRSDTFELDRLKPGDLLFWIGTYDTRHEPPVTHVMIYLGTNRQNGRRVMLGASEGRTFDGKPCYGVSVFDFKVSGTLRRQDSTFVPGNEYDGRFIGYGSIPGL